MKNLKQRMPAFTAEMSLGYYPHKYTGKSDVSFGSFYEASLSTKRMSSINPPHNYPCTRKVDNALCDRDYQTGKRVCKQGFHGRTCYEIVWGDACDDVPIYPLCK